MTNQAPQYEPLPANYWRADNSSLTVAQIRKAQAEGKKRAVDEFNQKAKVMWDRLVRRHPDREKRALAYLHKPVELWAEQLITFKDDFEADWQDWEHVAPDDFAVRDAVLREVEVVADEMVQARRAAVETPL